MRILAAIRRARVQVSLPPRPTADPELFRHALSFSATNVLIICTVKPNYLHGVGAAEHGQLPQCPVPVVEVVLQKIKPKLTTIS
jgi:hypothetical protein